MSNSILQSRKLSYMLLAALIIPAGCTTPEAEIVNVSVAKGKSYNRIFYYWDGQCKTLRTNVVVLDHPKHGNIQISDGFQEIPLEKKYAIGDGRECAGKTVGSKVVTYAPDRGFSGVDEARLQASSPSVGTFRRTIKFNVE